MECRHMRCHQCEDESSTIARLTRERDEAESAASVLGKELDKALAEVKRLRKLLDFSEQHNVPELLDHYWEWSKSAERARVVAWLRGQGAWEKHVANAIEAGEHDR